MSSVSRFFTVLAIAAGSTQTLRAQPTPLPATSPVVLVNVSNSAAYSVTLDEVRFSSGTASGQPTGKRMRRAILARAAAAAIDAGRISDFKVTVNENEGAVTPVSVIVILTSETGKTCKVTVQAALKAKAIRHEIQVGDIGVFFDASGDPRPRMCAP